MQHHERIPRTIDPTRPIGNGCRRETRTPIRKTSVAAILLFLSLALAPLCGADAGEKNMLRNGDFKDWKDGTPVGWRQVAQRDAIRPPLKAKSTDSGTWAMFEALPSGISTGAIAQRIDPPRTRSGWVRLSCRVRTEGDQDPISNTRVVLEWERAPGTRGWNPNREFARVVGHPEPNVWDFERTMPAPPDSPGADVLLFQCGGTRGSVAFGNVRVEEVPKPPSRRSKIATACLIPKRGATWESNLAAIRNLTRQAAEREADLVLFGEGVTVIGTGKPYVEVAEPIPGPASEALSKIACEYKIFLAAGLYERDGETCYNTAILLDRQGKLVGRYRKIHLPYSEFTGGLQPGDAFPVFNTEIGQIGLQICYDHHFQETARGLALAGAEIILTPIWGDGRADNYTYDIIARARAIDNAVYYVTSNYSQSRSLIIDPFGHFLADTDGNQPAIAVADIDPDLCQHLDLPYRSRQIYSMNWPLERRPKAYEPLSNPEPPLP